MEGNPTTESLENIKAETEKSAKVPTFFSKARLGIFKDGNLVEWEGQEIYHEAVFAAQAHGF